MSKYDTTKLGLLKKTYDEKQIVKKSEDFNMSKTTKELESRIADLESSLGAALNELDYIKGGRTDLFTKEEIANFLKMIPPTTQRSVNIPVPIDQGGTGVTTLAEAQELIGGGTVVDLASSDVTGILQIANGGTGESVAQLAINALTAVSGGSNEQVLTKDTGSGNAMWKDAFSEVVGDTTPQLGGQLDNNGFAIGDGTLEIVKFGETASAVNEVTITNAATGNNPVIEATGDDTNISLTLKGKGSGGVYIQGSASQILDTNGNELVKFTVTSSAVNEITLANAATGNDPSLTATGGDSNVGIDLVCKGTGGVTLRHEPRITTITSSATPTINTDNCDAVTITALAAAITSMTTNLSGTPKNFQRLMIRIKDDGTARAITWGASFEACGFPLPTTTVISKRLTILFIYDTVTSKWGCISASQEA